MLPGHAHGQEGNFAAAIQQQLMYYQLEKAIETGQKAINASPGKPIYYYLTGRAYQLANRHDSALAYYTKAFRLDSMKTEHVMALAKLFQFHGRNDKAIETLERLPGSPLARQELASVYLQENQYAKSLRIYDSLLSQDSVIAFYHYQRGKALEGMKRGEAAARALEKALHYSPGNQRYLNGLVNQYIRNKKYEKGLQLCKKQLDSDTTNRQVIKFYAYLNLLTERYDSARTFFEKALALGDSSYFTLKYTGISQVKAEDYFNAMPYLEKAREMKENDLETTFYLGLAAGRGYDKNAGIRYLTDVLHETLPDSHQVYTIYNELADYHAGYSRYQKGLEYLQEAWKYKPDGRFILYRLAQYHDRNMKNPELALAYYEKFMKTRAPGAKVQEIPGAIVVSYYDIAARRIDELKEELFFAK
jgi:tetratricopeptide (TPR) repeat protein